MFKKIYKFLRRKDKPFFLKQKIFCQFFPKKVFSFQFFDGCVVQFSEMRGMLNLQGIAGQARNDAD